MIISITNGEANCYSGVDRYSMETYKSLLLSTSHLGKDPAFTMESLNLEYQQSQSTSSPNFSRKYHSKFPKEDLIKDSLEVPQKNFDATRTRRFSCIDHTLLSINPEITRRRRQIWQIGNIRTWRRYSKWLKLKSRVQTNFRDRQECAMVYHYSLIYRNICSE